MINDYYYIDCRTLYLDLNGWSRLSIFYSSKHIYLCSQFRIVKNSFLVGITRKAKCRYLFSLLFLCVSFYHRHSPRCLSLFSLTLLPLSFLTFLLKDCSYLSMSLFFFFSISPSVSISLRRSSSPSFALSSLPSCSPPLLLSPSPSLSLVWSIKLSFFFSECPLNVPKKLFQSSGLSYLLSHFIISDNREVTAEARVVFRPQQFKTKEYLLSFFIC